MENTVKVLDCEYNWRCLMVDGVSTKCLVPKTKVKFYLRPDLKFPLRFHIKNSSGPHNYQILGGMDTALGFGELGYAFVRDTLSPAHNYYMPFYSKTLPELIENLTKFDATINKNSKELSLEEGWIN